MQEARAEGSAAMSEHTTRKRELLAAAGVNGAARAQVRFYAGLVKGKDYAAEGGSLLWRIGRAETPADLELLEAEMRGAGGASPATRRRWARALEVRRGELRAAAVRATVGPLVSAGAGAGK